MEEMRRKLGDIDMGASMSPSNASGISPAASTATGATMRSAKSGSSVATTAKSNKSTQRLPGKGRAENTSRPPPRVGVVSADQTEYRATVPALAASFDPNDPNSQAALLEEGVVDGRVKFSTIWRQGQHRLGKVQHLLARCHDALDVPDAHDLETLSHLPTQFLDIEFRHMTAGLDQLRPLREQEDDDPTKTDGFIPVSPPLVVSDPKPAETTTVTFVPTRKKNPIAEVRQYTKNKDRWGAIFEFGDASLASVERRERWNPSFQALEEAEKTLTALEAFNRRVVDADSIEHPSKVTQGEKEDMLSEGLGQENDELSRFLIKWLEDINHRLGIILTYEQTKKNNKLHTMNHHGTQTSVPYPSGGPTTTPQTPSLKQPRVASPTVGHNQIDESNPYALLDEGNVGRGGPSSRRRGRRGGGSNFSSNNAGFQEAALRYTAALKIQSIFRGAYTRSITGNFNKGRRTLFHAVDRRIARLWCERVVMPTSAPGGRDSVSSSSPPWLMSICGSLLSGKLASDHAHMPRPLSFVEYTLQYLPEGFPGEPVEVSGTRLLATVNQLQTQDPAFTLMYRLLLGDFTPWQEAVLSKLCHRIGELQTKTVNLSPTFVSLELDTENWMNPSAIRNLIKSLVKTLAEANVVTARTWALARVLFQEEEPEFPDPDGVGAPTTQPPAAIGGRINTTIPPKVLFGPLETEAPEIKLTMKQLMLILPMAMYDDYVPSRDIIRLLLPPSALSANSNQTTTTKSAGAGGSERKK